MNPPYRNIAITIIKYNKKTTTMTTIKDFMQNGYGRVVLEDNKPKAYVNYDKEKECIFLAFNDCMPDIEIIPRGLYLTEVFGGDYKADGTWYGAWLRFNYNKKADPVALVEELAMAIAEL